jgi:hypothetical protein
MIPTAHLKDCQHSWSVPGNRLKIVETLNDWLGPTLAILACEQCSLPALLYLVAWQGNQMSDRIYAASPLDEAVVQTYLKNISRDYCDLERKQAETEALINIAIGPASLLRTSLPGLIVNAVSTRPATATPRDWQSIREEDFDNWAGKLQ